MQAKDLLTHYRGFAARAHLSTAFFAVFLVAAIIVLMIVAAMPSQAAFLAAETQNFATLNAEDDIGLFAVAALFFLAALAAAYIGRRKSLGS